MAKAITTIKQRLQYQPQHAAWFAANQALFNSVAVFYFDVIQAHSLVLTLSTKEALTALETLTHATEKNPNPVMITCRVSPRNTSRERARCGAKVIRYRQGWHPQEGYTPGAPLVRCPVCQMRGHADRNASFNIGQQLIARYLPHPGETAQPKQEKPRARRVRSGRVSQETGVIVSQDAQRHKPPSMAVARHGDGHGHGTAQAGSLWMEKHPSSIPTQLRLFSK